MGAILSEQAKEPKTERLNSFKKSQASNLQAEVFLEELQYVLDEDLLENLVMRPQGMNPRVKGAGHSLLKAGLCLWPWGNDRTGASTQQLVSRATRVSLPPSLSQ